MNTALKKPLILLPASHIDPQKWAVVACDQFTSQPDYWAKAEAIVGDSPSTLRITLPEVYLDESESRVPKIHAAMEQYLNDSTLVSAVKGYVLVERTTASGVRTGLIVSLDLEQYDYSEGSTSLIRATEGTVASRVPPRAKIRSGALLESPHVMMLIDDPDCTVIEPQYAGRQYARKLYDFDLMLGGGHLRGWAVDSTHAEDVEAAMAKLAEKCNGLLYAVGDGNHSLAAARMCWLQIRDTLTEEERKNHPARFALVELVNLNCPALQFEPIHRVMFNVDTAELMKGLKDYMATNGDSAEEGDDLIVFDADSRIGFKSVQHPLPLLQTYLDEYLASHPEAEIDYIHGDEALAELVRTHPGSVGFMPRTFDKAELFDSIRKWGALPRKTFSMGEAVEKRYYMETRRIL